MRDAADSITRAGGVAHALQVDVSDEAAVTDCLRDTVDLLGDLDVAVVNAGVAPPTAPSGRCASARG